MMILRLDLMSNKCNRMGPFRYCQRNGQAPSVNVADGLEQSICRSTALLKHINDMKMMIPFNCAATYDTHTQIYSGHVQGTLIRCTLKQTQSLPLTKLIL